MNTEQQKLGTTQLQSDQRSAFFCCGNAQTLECPQPIRMADCECKSPR